MVEHGASRDITAGLEKGLRDALHTAGYQLLNEVKSRHPIDEELMAQVLNALAGRFSGLLKVGTHYAESVG